MKLNMKLRYLLLALYEHKYNGKLYEIEEIFADNGIRISQFETEELARTLTEDGMIKTISIGETIYAQITVDGVEYLEESNFFTASSYLPQDRIKPLEREILRSKLDELHTQLMASELGNLLPEVTLVTEMEELKSLLNTLGKRSWIQILKGKVYEIGIGKISQEEINKLLQNFETHPAPEGSQITDYNI